MSLARFDRERLLRARRLRVFRRVLGLARLACSVALLLAVYWSGSVPAFAAALAPYGSIARAAATIALVLVAVWAVGVPFALAIYRRERVEGLSVQPPPSFAIDQLKALALNVALIGIASVGWYGIEQLPLTSLAIGLAAFTLAAIATLAGPLLLRAFYRLEPVDADLAARVRSVGERAGVRVGEVRSWRLSEKATTANAAVLGLGPTKQIAIADTLARARPPEQVEAVVAHELAHVVHRDTARGVLVFGASLAVALLALRIALDAWTPQGAGDVATYPLLLAGLELLALVGTPVVLAYSRSREAAADAFASRLVAPSAMAGALVWLAETNLSDPEPPRWDEILFMSHPSIGSRLRALGVGPATLS